MDHTKEESFVLCCTFWMGEIARLSALGKGADVSQVDNKCNMQVSQAEADGEV